jgi:hypothetical protein
MSSIKTVQQEIDRLKTLSKDKVWNKYNSADEAPYYNALCEAYDRQMSLDEFYKEHPYYNPDYTSEYWQKQIKMIKDLWNQETI